MNSKYIIPSIVSTEAADVCKKIEQADDFAEWVHVDITDGVFAGPPTWNNPEDLKTLGGRVAVEVHLMVDKPEEEIRRWVEVADRIIFHYEAVSNLDDLLSITRIHGGQSGLSILFDTPVDEIKDMIDSVDVVHLMSIKEIGAYGAEFDKGIYKKIKDLRKIAPSVMISVDGGVNDKNAKKLFAAGADHLIAGSFIWKSPKPKLAFWSLASFIK